MSRRPSVGVLVAIVSIAAGGRTVLWAQGPPPRGREVLTVSVDARASTDNLHSGESGGPAANSMGQLMVDYRPFVTPVQLQVQGSAVGRYDGSVGQMMLVGENIGASLGAPLGKRTSVHASASMGYAPQYSLVLRPSIPIDTLVENPGLVPNQTLDFATTRRSAYMSSLSASASRRLTSRSSVSLSYGHSQSLFVHATDPSVRSARAEARFQQQVTKHLGFHAGYGLRMADYLRSPTDPSGERSLVTPTTLVDLDIGLDYSDGFAISRNASLNFSTGSSITQIVGMPRRFFVTGNATFAYKLGRRGRASLDYRRAVDIVPGFGQPVFSDSVSAQTSENIGRRLQLSANVDYTLGTVGSADPGHRYESLTGSARASWAVARGASAYFQYTLYHHFLGAQVDTLQAVPHDELRRGISAGLSYSVPLIRDTHTRERSPVEESRRASRTNIRLR